MGNRVGGIDSRLEELANRLPTLKSVWNHKSSGRKVTVAGEIQASAFSRNNEFELFKGAYPIPNIGQIDPETGIRHYSDQDVTMLRQIAVEQEEIESSVKPIVADEDMVQEDLAQADMASARRGSKSAD